MRVGQKSKREVIFGGDASFLSSLYATRKNEQADYGKENSISEAH
jgi:hypothetical protein